MTTRLHIELEAGRADAEPRTVVLGAPDDATAGAVLDVLGAHLGMTSAAGAVQARSLICGNWLERAAAWGDIGLLRGERLSLTVGIRAPGPTGPLLRWAADGAAGLTGSVNPTGRLAVNRPPRATQPEPSLAVHLPRRQQTRPPRRFPLGAMVIPLLIGGLLLVVTRRWEIVLFSLFTPVMVGWNYVEERRAHRDDVAQYGRTYDETVADLLERVSGLTQEWTDWLHRYHPSPAEVMAVGRRLTVRLWERQPQDPDFLRVRLGLGTRRAPVTLHRDEADAGRTSDDEPDVDGAARADGVPVLVDLRTDGVLALLGEDHRVSRTAAWVAAQLAMLHSPRDVTLVAALGSAEDADWWRWLPHVPQDWSVPTVVHDRRAAEDLLIAVAEFGRARRDQGGRRASAPTSTIVVFVDDRLGADPALLGDVLASHDVGVVTVWLGTDQRAVPTAAPHLLDLGGRDRAAELVAHRGGARLSLAAEGLSQQDVLDLSAWLAPVRDAADAQRALAIPERISLEDLIPDVASPLAMRRRWESAPATQLLTRLGVGADGPIELDLGPEGSHALVGGTTGSGKSELLQTLVAAIATSYPPSRVGFLLVDYKGGAAFKDAVHLPHCVGVVTDLDAHLTRRVLHALDAEIRRREELLATAGARDLTELRQRTPDSAPGDLLVVVDEFSTLAKEIPEFVEGVVDVAARGRSLGLRLVLATQRPAGVINDRIRANVGVRIALRVNDEADSTDVIGDRAAAHVSRDRPGRAYLRSHRDLAEFQSAFVGGVARAGRSAPIEVRDVSPVRVEPSAPPAAGSTVLEAIAASCQRVTQLGRWTRPHVPWLPALPAVVTVDDVTRSVTPLPAGSVVLGLADLPRQQRQSAVALDLERHRNLLVFGTSRSGKTTVLRTLAAGLIDSLGPDQVEIYCLDFAGHGLHVLEPAPQCVGVVGPGEPGRIARLLRRLTVTVTQRSRQLAASGATDFDELARQSVTPMPRIVVLLDGYAGATSVLERVDGGRLLDRLERLVPDGPAVGVHFLITADRRAAVPGSLTSVVTTRLVLRMAERDEYTLLGVDTGGVQAALTPGRGFIQGTTEVQVAVLAAGQPEQEQRALDALVERSRTRWASAAQPLGRMPDQVALNSLPLPMQTWRLPVAIGDEHVLPVCVDLTDGPLLVAGPPRSGRSTALATIGAAARRAPLAAAVAVFTTRRADSALAALGRVAEVGPVDAADPDQLARGLGAVDALLEAGREVLCLCDDVDGLPDPASTKLEELVRRGRDEPVRVVVSSDNRWALRAYAGVVPAVRQAKRALLLAAEVDLDGDLVGVRLRTPLEPLSVVGRGFLAGGGLSELVQIAHVGDDIAPLPPHSPSIANQDTSRSST